MRSRSWAAAVGGAWRTCPGDVVARRAERLPQDDEPDAIVHQHLQPDVADEGGHPGEHLVRLYGRPSRSLDLGVARARAGCLEHGVADERDRLRRVQEEAPIPVTPGQLGRREDEEPLLLPRRQPHARIVAARGRPVGPT